MELVDRYVEAVRKHLSRAERDDIAAELRETLQSQIDELGAEHGRAPTEEEIATLLQRYGAPEIVASRYGAPMHLIGPDVYPQYRATLKIILSIVGIVLAVAIAATATLADDPAASAWRVLWAGAIVVLAHFTAVTLVFARVERMKRAAHPADVWNPRDLAAPPAAAKASVSRAEAGASLLFSLLLLLWWIDVVPINRWLFGDRWLLAPAPVWEAVTPLILGLLIANLLVSGIASARPHWVRFYDAAGAAIDVGILVLVYQALTSPALIAVADPSSPAARLGALLEGLLRVSLLVWAIIAAGSIALAARRWLIAGRQLGSIQKWAS
jgi:hypothetical protein